MIHHATAPALAGPRQPRGRRAQLDGGVGVRLLADLWYHGGLRSCTTSSPHTSILRKTPALWQFYLLAQAGYRVTGIDLAEDFLAVVRGKALRQAVPPLEAEPLFRASSAPACLLAYERLLEYRRTGCAVMTAQFLGANVKTYDFGGDCLDANVCCGSVLSFIENYEAALRKMAASLRPGGHLLLEVEQKRNLDLLWPLVDKLLGGWLDYQQEWSESWAKLRGLCARSTPSTCRMAARSCCRSRSFPYASWR